MDKELLAKFLTELGSTLKDTKDFSIEQLPLIAKEIITYNLAESIMGIVLCLGGVGLSVYFWKKIQKYLSDSNDDSSPLFILPGVGALGCSIGVVVNLTNVIFIYFAPRVFLLEYVAHLLRVTK